MIVFSAIIINMRKLVILFAVFALTVGSHITEVLLADDETKKILTDMQNACVKELNGAPDMMEKIDTGNFLDPKDEKCVMQCYLMKAGFMKPNGDYDGPKIKSVYDKKYYGMVHKCVLLPFTTICDKAYTSYKCVIETVLENARN